ncbi:MAG TPA: aldo/keto reductase [Streptosporangiaceae bacterium]|jgi:D-threo-aldose 1-dehydrogenase|nr:aldo/keto reductase [Streptosporangiaceae bacterium]
MAGPLSPRLALGCAQLGNLYRARSEEEAAAILEEAWDAGIRQFDTAPHYGLGLSERRLGAFLHGKPRDQFIVSTKVGRLLVPSPETAWRDDDEGFAVPAALRRVWDFSAAGIRASLESSMERLGLDRVDTVLIHDPDEHADEALAVAAPALAALRDEGIIDAIGVGNRDTALLTRIARETDIDVMMLAGRYTLLDQSALDTLLPACAEHDVGVLNAAIFNSGILAQRHPDAGAHFEYAAASWEVLERARALARVCEAHGTSLPAAALAFAAAHPAVTAIVVGADNAEQVRGNVALLSAPPPAAFWEDLRELGLIRIDAPVPQSRGH